jgi:hypothetical protein
MLIFGILYFVIVYTSNTCLLYLSFPLQLLARNLKLLVIIFIGVFFSRLKSKGLGKTHGPFKLLIAIVITLGVIIFNVYGVIYIIY